MASSSSDAKPHPSLNANKSLDDMVLGAIGRSLPKSDVLNRLAKLLSSYSGSDKAFDLIASTLKLIVPFLTWRAAMQHKHGKRAGAQSNAAESFTKLAKLIGDSRMLWRFFGLIPIIQWLIKLEDAPAGNKKLVRIERLQALSMLAYYPLEHLYYFGAHGIYSIPQQRLAKISIWSIRAWAAYVFLHFLHLKEDVRVLQEKGENLQQVKRKAQVAAQSGEDEKAATSSTANFDYAAEVKALKAKRLDLFYDFFVNLAYFPQTVHWSLEQGVFTNDFWVTLLGWAAAAGAFKRSWNATAA